MIIKVSEQGFDIDEMRFKNESELIIQCLTGLSTEIKVLRLKEIVLRQLYYALYEIYGK